MSGFRQNARRVVRAAGGVLLVGLVACSSPEATDEVQPVAPGMNLLLITLDTTRADHLSCQGGPEGLTPNLDGLAARSAHFLNATSETNVTNPSHLTIMTGLRAIEHGILNNVHQVPPDLETLPEAMKAAGYRTAGFAAAPHVGEDFGWRGFDRLNGPPEVMDAHLVTDGAIRFISAAPTERFFVWAHYFDAHTLYEPPRAISKKFYTKDPTLGNGPLLAAHTSFNRGEREALVKWLGQVRDPEYPLAMYAAEVNFMDREIGRLLRSLTTRHVADNTVVVVVADHGESLGEHDIYYSHSGLYEPQVRIPFIIHVPGQAATQTTASVSTLDVVPTLRDLLGVGPTHPFSGRSLAGLVRGTDEGWGERSLVHQNAHNKGVAVRHEGWKLIWPIAEAEFAFPDAPSLFNLVEDPEELDDLSAAHPDRMKQLEAYLEPWITRGVLTPQAEPTHLSEDDLERLRALGYVN